ncbi:MAG TPA: VWA domain-containing protein [Bryobacteraceae bacterium]|nr:VWA domain-containing protein [Bryobacteraceae bacterium]
MGHTGITVIRRRQFFLGMVAAAARLSAQDLVFRTGVALVRVDAQVNAAGGGVDGLRKEDFEIRDNGQLQRALYCSQEDQPLDLLLLFDNSGSMLPAMRRLAASAHTALSELRKGDRVAVANFNADAWLIGEFNDDLTAVEHTVSSVVDLRYGGGTHILAAIDSAGEYFHKHADPKRRHAILILTDDDGQSSASEKAVVKRLWEDDVLVCGLIIPTPMSQRGVAWSAGEENILGVAAKTGGETIDADDPGHAFREMLRRIRRRYSIYYAMPAGKAGSARKVDVSMSPQGRSRYPDAQVLARKGYVIPKTTSQ